jgi:D-aminoacyl-tRNA deacylase
MKERIVIALLQRVSRAEVSVAGETVGAIGTGILALIGVRAGDGPADAARLAERILGYRLFEDAAGRMNRSVREAHGALLLVPQFTLAADTNKGTRAGFSTAAEPIAARALFEALCAHLTQGYAPVSTGVFGAHMAVSLVNDGPVTFWLES